MTARTRADRALDAALARTRRRIRLGEAALYEPSDGGVGEVEAHQLVCRIMSAARLTEREAIVVHDRYYLGMPLWQVGDTIGNVGRERTRQVEERALEKMRKVGMRLCR